MRPATLAVHAPLVLPEVGAAGESPNVPPLYQTAGWEATDLAGNEAMGDGQGYFYARYGAPNSDGVAQAVAGLEGAEAGACFASGMAAISAVLTALARPGSVVVAVRSLFGGTIYALDDLSRRLGFTVRWAEAARPEAVAPLLEGDVSLVHVETISNPLLRVADVAGLAPLVHARGALLTVDGTFATPVLSRPLSLGADLVIHSATKFLSGHGDLAAGVVCGPQAHLSPLRRALALHGANLDPFAAWLLARGLRTLHLRLTRQSDNAARVAQALAAHPAVARVHYPGLAAHPDHPLAAAQLDAGGPMVAFEVAVPPGQAALGAARSVFDRLRLIRRVASLGDVESMVLHPATTSHRRLPAEERARAGISDGLLRLSIGIEDPRDLIEDLDHALSGG